MLFCFFYGDSAPWHFIETRFGAHSCTVPIVTPPWMTGMCKQSALNGACGRCQPAQRSRIPNAREKGHSSPNCSTKPERPGLYLAWPASMTRTGEAMMEVQKKNHNKHKAEAATTCTRPNWKGDELCDNKGSNPRGVSSGELNRRDEVQVREAARPQTQRSVSGNVCFCHAVVIKPAGRFQN